MRAVKEDVEVISFLETCGEENLQFLLVPDRLSESRRFGYEQGRRVRYRRMGERDQQRPGEPPRDGRREDRAELEASRVEADAPRRCRTD